ncbi:MAG: 6-phospho-beta-galactosidase [Lachnospiraceae bacterium]|nr:6-phospho-beta-galactosidase [Lachnospiraceae bacterium]
MKLPDTFIFGGATAAYQCEGESKTHGKGKTAWDDYLEDQGWFSPDPASDFYHQYPEDLKLCREFGINGIRISIAWSRIFPTGEGQINKEGVDFYHKMFLACRDYGVEPFVTLHHFDTPDALHKNGDFLNPHTIDCFEQYAKFCFEEYKDEVKYWFTFNEIWPVSENQYTTGTFPPGEKYNLTKTIESLHAMITAHAKAVIAFKEGGYPGRIGIIHSLETKYPYDASKAEDVLAAERSDAVSNKFLLDATFLGHYSEETLDHINFLFGLDGKEFKPNLEDMDVIRKAAKYNDCLGINYYQSHFLRAYAGESQIHHNGTGAKGTAVNRIKGIGEQVLKEGIDRTDWDWLIYPEGLCDMILRIKHDYPNYKEIYITENGMGYKDDFEDGTIDDSPRIDYIKRHLQWIAKAMEKGANVKGYFVWSLMDMFSWSNGYNKRYGLFYVDYKTQKRYPKKSAYWYKEISKTKEV